ncbi:MAG: uracil-DNA glycosylase family protein [Bacteroidales bacterium]|nr:uracil-DNA glycosylase family protein [Bacteroidales bacterium]
MEHIEIEKHPFEPFLPEGAKVLVLGTFPPGEHRWSMNFYYPNPINDFWRICGLLFLNDKNALYDVERKTFREQECRKLATDHHIALNDTAREVRRLKGNASDKYLEILKPVPLQELLDKIPDCHTIATTGEKAADVIAGLTGTTIPKVGEMVESDSGLRIWRMPSTSRAYPMKMELKAEHYARLFRDAGCFS